MQKILIRAIQYYQYLISPLIGPCCRFYPGCSQYAIQALEEHGLMKGLLLMFKRLVRCHPFCHGGHDPVPEKGN